MVRNQVLEEEMVRVSDKRGRTDDGGYRRGWRGAWQLTGHPKKRVAVEGSYSKQLVGATTAVVESFA